MIGLEYSDFHGIEYLFLMAFHPSHGQISISISINTRQFPMHIPPYHNHIHESAENVICFGS